jgi:type-F conjugative transfer system pilin assembly protein TrbC
MEEANVLRLLVIYFCLYTTVSYAEETKYKDPDRKALERVKNDTKIFFNKVNAVVKDTTFLNDLQKQKKDASQVPNGLKQSLYDFSGINPRIREDQIMSKVLAAGEKIEGHTAEPWTSSPLIMISFSMPESKIKSLMSEGARIGANVVIRGALNNDLPTTIRRIQKIASENGAGGVQIDPTLFSRFKVTTVPTFILPLEPIKTCNEKGCEVPKHVKAHGTATLRYFLEKASRLGNPEEKLIAEHWLNNYKEKIK